MTLNQALAVSSAPIWWSLDLFLLKASALRSASVLLSYVDEHVSDIWCLSSVHTLYLFQPSNEQQKKKKHLVVLVNTIGLCGRGWISIEHNNIYIIIIELFWKIYIMYMHSIELKVWGNRYRDAYTTAFHHLGNPQSTCSSFRDGPDAWLLGCEKTHQLIQFLRTVSETKWVL